MAQINGNALERYSRWYKEIEMTFGGNLEATLMEAVGSDFGRISQPEEAFRRLSEIGEKIKARELDFSDLGIDEYRFKSLRAKVIAVRLRLAFDRLRRGSAHKMVGDPALAKAVRVFWEIHRLYVNEGISYWKSAGILRDEYYAVLEKVDLALELSAGREK